MTYIWNYISSLFYYLYKVFKTIFNFIVSIPSKLITDYKVIKEKLKNLKSTNLNLGIMHLQSGRTSDAILRFKITKKFFKSPEAIDLLGWSYFIKNDFTNAELTLDKSELKKFIKETNYKEIPKSILSKYYDLTYLNYINQFISKKINLPNEFITFLLDGIKSLPKGSEILDLGCNTGIIGSILNAKLKKHYTLTGIENSLNMVNYVKEIKEDNFTIYDYVLFDDILNFMAKCTKKFNIIISFHSLIFKKDLSDIFTKISSLLVEEGFFSALFPVNDKTQLSSFKKHFVYSKNDILNQSKSSNLKIIKKNLLTFGEDCYLFILFIKENKVK